jgi:RNA polymerase sigma-70 factor (ECF subfamily)
MCMPALAPDRPPSRAADRPLAAADFDALYQARYGDVVAMLHAYVGDAGEAQDLAQESFCRAWQRWGKVSRYEDPMAWIRRVAMNLANSRWRRLRVARTYLRREQLTDVPELGPEHVALVTALRQVPADQRRAMVLHYLVDLPVAEVAHEMGVAAGTVKSWLHRGRTALAAQLADAAEEVGP